MSQHCLCGHRHRKSLSERTHNCQVCGLEGGRDTISAVLASCVTMTDPADPATATVDYTLTNRLLADQATRHTLSQTSGVQERPTASTDTPNPTPGVGEGIRPPAIKAGSAPRTGTVSTTTPNEPPSGDHVGTRTTTNPNAPPVDRIPAATGLRDIS